MKLCFFGDSIGKGIIYDKDKGRYVPLDKSFVKLVENEENCEIENFSRFGCTVTKGEQLVDKNAEKIENSDFVVLNSAEMTATMTGKRSQLMPEAEHGPKTPLSLFIETYKKMITEVKKLGKIPVILNLPLLTQRNILIG